MLDERTARFLHLKYSEFYRASSLRVERVEQREFGFGDFENAIVKRHIGFRNSRVFNQYLAASAPASVSVSSAFYSLPEARPMEKKGWLGSELVFDLDASDLHLPCQQKHGRSWVCSTCLDSVKRETIKLVEDFLVPDFGISKGSISINFSGNRGYHVHVSDRRFYPLKAGERKQITDYVTGTGLSLKSLFPTLGERETDEESGGKRYKTLRGPKYRDPGWRGKLAAAVISALNSGYEALVKMGVDAPTAKRLIRNKANIIFGITTGNWDQIDIPHKERFWANALGSIAISQTSAIDRNVTSGIEHLIRLPGTLHPGTGLQAKPVQDVESFDPMKAAPFFRDGHVRVKTTKVPEFSMNGLPFGPFDGKTVELPTYAAVYLILKKTAVLA